MEEIRNRRWVRVVGIVAGVLLLLVVGGFIGWRMLMNHFVHQYYRETLSPIELVADDLAHYPARYHLDNVPWIATREWTCSANSLAMVAAQHGTDATIQQCNFLMGFTYGATEVPGTIVVQFFGDPEPGLSAAAPYLGLQRRHYVTDDETLYLDALRSYLSQGYAVRVALDVGILYDLDQELPHSDVLVGYDEDGFNVYETVCLPEFPCQPCNRPPGEKGLFVPHETLLEAVRSHGKTFAYPWRYALTVFQRRAREDDLRPIWTRNGQLLIGGVRYGPRQGADAIEGLAANVEELGAQLDASQITPALEAAVHNRRANAAYLREAFADQDDVGRAAALLDRAADDYETVLGALDDGVADPSEAERIAAALRDAAAKEREAGEIFLARGQ